MEKVIKDIYFNFSRNNEGNPFEKREEDEEKKEDKSGTPVEIPIINPPRQPGGIPPAEEILSKTVIYE
mgnify:CR=1 FL=1